MKKHWLDKPILRDVFWYIVLPRRLRMFVAEQKTMPAEMEKVLNDNLWELYESDAQDADAVDVKKYQKPVDLF